MPKLFYWPIWPIHINQHFGENKICIDIATNKNVIGCDGKNPPPGYQSVYSMMQGHNGLDLMARGWQNCYAAREGTVIEKETEPERGLGIGILHGPYFGRYFKTRYWHLAGIEVNIGDKVRTGELIGFCDNTGYSSGNHLHFEVKETDALGNTINHDNGYFGAINPYPMMFDEFALQVYALRLYVEKLAQLVDKLSAFLRR